MGMVMLTCIVVCEHRASERRKKMPFSTGRTFHVLKVNTMFTVLTVGYLKIFLTIFMIRLI